MSAPSLRPLASALGLALMGWCSAYADERVLAPVTVQASGEALGDDRGQRAIDLERAERIPQRDLQDVFQTEPSVQVGSGARNGQKIILRGIEDLNLNIQIDGARQGANLFHHQGRLLVDPALLKAVEVNTGPSPADAGPGALGGSVRFETVDAQDLLEPGQTQGGRLQLRRESADNLFGGSLMGYGLMGPDNKLGLLVSLGREVNDELRAGGGESIRNTEGSRNSALFKASLLELRGHSLKFSAERQTNEGGPLRANFPWQTNNATQSLDDQNQTREAFTVKHRFQPRPGEAIDLETTLYQTKSSIELGGDNPTGTGRDALWATTSTGLDIRNRFALRGGGWTGVFTAGLDYFHDENFSDSLADPRLSETADNLGLYGQLRVQWAQLGLSAGARLDRYDTEYANGFGTDGTAVSPNATFDWQFLPAGPDSLVAFVGYGESIRGGKLNQAGWLTKYFLPPAFLMPRPFTLGVNGELEPERALQTQIGLRWVSKGVWAPSDRLEIGAVAFETRIRNYQVVPGEGANGITDRIFNAPDDITSRGFELSGAWSSASWMVRSGFAHSIVRNFDGQPLDTTGDSARVGVSVGDRLFADVVWRAQREWEFGYSLEAVEELKDVPANRPPKPGYVLHGLQAVWQPVKLRGFSLTMSVENLFDRRYLDHTSVLVRQASNTATARAGLLYGSPEAGRNLQLVASYRF